jgi:hypothetical protein
MAYLSAISRIYLSQFTPIYSLNTIIIFILRGLIGPKIIKIKGETKDEEKSSVRVHA